MGEACGTRGKFEKYKYSFDLEKNEGKRTISRLRHGCEDNIKIDLKIGYGGVGWVHLC
jgi:hypothetical protein